MPHPIFAKFQPVSQWIVSDPAHRARRLRVDPVLFLRYAACVQSVEFDGLEAIRNRQTGLSSRLRFTGRSVGGDPEMVGASLTEAMLKRRGVCLRVRLLKGPGTSLQQRIRPFSPARFVRDRWGCLVYLGCHFITVDLM